MKAKNYIIIIIGSIILSFGIYNVHSQSEITEGGVLGLILLLEYWFLISPATSSFIIDSICFLLGFKILGGGFFLSSIVATASFSLSYRLWQMQPPVIPDLSNQPILAAVVGAVFVGVGVGLCVKQGAAAGADDTLALIYTHYRKKNVARFYLMSDITILTLSLTYIPLERIVYSLITVVISGFIIGKISCR